MYLIEIYKSVQGESSFAGLPCIFVRLAGCNLRCSWCDSEYTFKGGYKQSPDEVVAEVAALAPVRLVEFTGGEPMLQERNCSADGAAARAGLHADDRDQRRAAPRECAESGAQDRRCEMSRDRAKAAASTSQISTRSPSATKSSLSSATAAITNLPGLHAANMRWPKALAPYCFRLPSTRRRAERTTRIACSILANWWSGCWRMASMPG